MGAAFLRLHVISELHLYQRVLSREVHVNLQVGGLLVLVYGLRLALRAFGFGLRLHNKVPLFCMLDLKLFTERRGLRFGL